MQSQFYLPSSALGHVLAVFLNCAKLHVMQSHALSALYNRPYTPLSGTISYTDRKHATPFKSRPHMTELNYCEEFSNYALDMSEMYSGLYQFKNKCRSQLFHSNVRSGVSEEMKI
jgi:hypothetical protein